MAHQELIGNLSCCRNVSDKTPPLESVGLPCAGERCLLSSPIIPHLVRMTPHIFQNLNYISLNFKTADTANRQARQLEQVSAKHRYKSIDYDQAYLLEEDCKNRNGYVFLYSTT